MYFWCRLLLVVKNNVRKPNVSGWHMEDVHTTVLLGVPDQLVVVPKTKILSITALAIYLSDFGGNMKWVK